MERKENQSRRRRRRNVEKQKRQLESIALPSGGSETPLNKSPCGCPLSSSFLFFLSSCISSLSALGCSPLASCLLVGPTSLSLGLFSFSRFVGWPLILFSLVYFSSPVRFTHVWDPISHSFVLACREPPVNQPTDAPSCQMSFFCFSLWFPTCLTHTLCFVLCLLVCITHTHTVPSFSQCSELRQATPAPPSH